MEWVTVKSGWLQEKKSGFGIIGRKWNPRYVVLYKEPVPALGIYEQRSDANPPYAPLRHLDLLPDTKIISNNQTSKDPEPSSSRRSSILGWIRKGSQQHHRNASQISIDTLHSPIDSKDQEDLKFVISRAGKSSFQLSFMARSVEERDKWICALNDVIKRPVVEQNSINASPSTFTNISPATTAIQTHYDTETLSYAGVVVLEGRVASRIRASLGRDQMLNPFSSSNDSALSSDSIVGDVSRSLAVINDPVEDSFNYQQAMIDRSKAETARDTSRLELQAQKLVGRFQSHVAKVLRKILDEYHRGGKDFSKQVFQYDEGPLKIQFIADYANMEEEHILRAYEWLRREMNAVRWVNKTRLPFMQPLLAVCEYKGFRVLAMLSLPLGDRTLVMEPQAGVFEEAATQEALQLAKTLNLAPMSYHTLDGKVLQIPIPATIEIHRLSSKRPKERVFQGEKSFVTTATTPAGLFLANVHDLIPSFPATEECFRDELHLRPELIESLPNPYYQGDTTVVKTLRGVNLPKYLDRLESLEILPIDSEDWRISMHEAGLNMAFLGAVAQQTTLPHVRDGAVVEMIGRVAKIIFRRRIRNTILHLKEVQALRGEEELGILVCDFVNDLIAGREVELGKLLEDRYGYSHYSLELMKSLPRNALLLSIQHNCGIRLNPIVYFGEGPIQAGDFEGFVVRINGSGAGCFDATQSNRSKTILERVSNVILPLGEEIWANVLRRALVAKEFIEMAEELMFGESWIEALRFGELAGGLCPKQHPFQVIVTLFLFELKSRAPINMVFKTSYLAEPKSLDNNVNELERLKLGLINASDRHFGPNHPFGIIIRWKLSSLCEANSSESLKTIGLELREQALSITVKALGKKHPWSQKALIQLADMHKSIKGFESAIMYYKDALAISPKHDPQLFSVIAGCFDALGDHEEALKWSNKCLQILDASEEKGSLWESTIEQIALLSQEIYNTSMSKVRSEAVESRSGPSSIEWDLKDILNSEFVPDSIASNLRNALTCYERLFEAQRKHDLEALDSERLLFLAGNIVSLTLKLANPAQSMVLKNIARRQMFLNDQSLQINEDEVKDLLVKMVAGSASPREMVEKILQKAEENDKREETEGEILVFFKLLSIVNKH